MEWRRSPIGTRASGSRSTLLRRFGQVPAVLVVVAVTCVAGVPKAFAFGTELPCTNRDTSAAFSPWLDPAQYFLASNGGFEQGSTNWILSADAAIVAGNEPYQLAGPTDANSLSLPTGATAESRTACVTIGEPTVRLFVDAPSVAGAMLTVHATVLNPTTGVALQTQYVVESGLAPAGWTPTPEIVIPNLVGGVLPEDLTLQFTTQGAPATWEVDDVYVDPYKQR